MKVTTIFGLLGIFLLVAACSTGPVAPKGEDQLDADSVVDDAPLTDQEIQDSGLDLEGVDDVLADLEDLDDELNFDDLDSLDQDLNFE